MQPELFEELAPSKSTRLGPAEAPVFIQPPAAIAFNAQHLVFIGMAMIIGLIAAFAGGVERGKALTRGPESVVPPAGAPALPATVTPRAPQRVVIPAATTRAPAATAGQHHGAYTIQLVTYTNMPAAERELARLKLKGHSAFLLQGNERVALCVGAFNTRQAAKQRLASFRRSYHDCFIRQR